MARISKVRGLMTISEQIDHDLKEAMKARQADKLSVLRMLKAAVKNAAIEKGGQAGVLDDVEATAIIRKQVKQRQDSIESFEKGGRAELADKERAEIGILQTYLPQMLAAGGTRPAHRRGHRRNGCHGQGADGRGDEGAPAEGRRTRRRPDAQPGSAAAARLTHDDADGHHRRGGHQPAHGI